MTIKMELSRSEILEITTPYGTVLISYLDGVGLSVGTYTDPEHNPDSAVHVRADGEVIQIHTPDEEPMIDYSEIRASGDRIGSPNPTCPSLPHPERFLTPRHRPDKVAPMPKTQTVYLANPDLYETDLRAIVDVMDELKILTGDGPSDLYAIEAKIVLGSKNGYIVGTLNLDEDFWRFTPENESDVQANVDWDDSGV